MAVMLYIIQNIDYIFISCISTYWQVKKVH
jgi:hypothetical protein